MAGRLDRGKSGRLSGEGWIIKKYGIILIKMTDSLGLNQEVNLFNRETIDYFLPI